MGSPVQVLGAARAFARDFPRDAMPAGYLWDVLDFVPSIIDTHLTGRGRWDWGSSQTGYGDIEAGILASFKEGDQLLVQTQGVSGGPAAQVLRLNADGGNPPGSDPSLNTWTPLGNTVRAVQNPFMLGEDVIHLDGNRTQGPELWRTGGKVPANAAHKFAPVGTTWKASMVTGGAPGEENMLRFSVVGQDLTAATSFDVNSFQYTRARITGLQGMRTVCLVFHPSSVERLRGGPFPAGTEPGGIILETLFDRVGCMNPKSIAVWNDQCIFADEHGVHITDGATIKSLTSQGGISYYWRQLYEGAATVVGTIFMDYYIITIRHPPTRPPLPLGGHWEDGPVFEPFDTPEPHDVARPPVPPIPPNIPPIRPPVPDPVPDAYNTTLICDLNRKQWFRFSNMNNIAFISSGGSTGMERVWGGMSGYARLARFGPTFYPNEGQPQVDANGTAVHPRLETAWYRLGQEGRKRVRFAYLSYDCRTYDGNTGPLRMGYLTSPTVGSTYQVAGTMPDTLGYKRVRLPVYKFPYGIAFYVEAIQPVGVVRIYDIGVEAQGAERSRV